MLERPRTGRELPGGAEGDVEPGAVLPSVPDGDDALRVGVGERPDQDVIHGAEDRRRAADPDREGERRARREAGVGPQATRGVPKIGDEGFDGVFPPEAPYLFTGTGRTAQLEPGGPH